MLFLITQVFRDFPSFCAFFSTDISIYFSACFLTRLNVSMLYLIIVFVGCYKILVHLSFFYNFSFNFFISPVFSSYYLSLAFLKLPLLPYALFDIFVFCAGDVIFIFRISSRHILNNCSCSFLF